MKEVLVGGISATVVGEDQIDSNSEVLMVVLAHGRNRSREATLKFAHILRKTVPNLVCVTWDLPNHGSRLIDPDLNLSWNQGNTLHMLQMKAIIDQGSAEAVDLLEMIPARLPDLKITKKVLLGISLGGYITWNVACNHFDMLTAAIPIITSPNTLAVMRQRWDEYAKQNPELAQRNFPTAFDDSVVKRMESEAAKLQAFRNNPLPIMAICGGDDPLVPAKYSIAWGEDALPQHRVEIVPGVKHEVVREMIDLTGEYLLSITTRV